MLVCLALVACASAPPPDEALCPPPSRPPLREVARPRPRAVPVARGPIASALDVSATLAPATTASVVAHTAGVVHALRVDVGAQVRRGDVLAVVGPAHGARGREESVRAPIDGVVLAREQRLGAPVVGDHMGLFTVGDLDHLVARAEVSEADAPRLRVGQPAELRAPSMPDRVMQSVVGRIDPTVTPDHTVAFELALANPDRALRPGVVAQVRVLLQRVDDALTLPADAVSLDGDGARVFVVDEGHARARRVAVGIRQGDTLQVVEGLHEGDRVLSPARLARDGDAVE